MRYTWVWVLAAAMAAPVSADQAADEKSAGMRRLNELTAQYTKQFYARSYNDAIVSATDALAAAEAAAGPEDVQVAQVLNDLGHLYALQQDLVRAEPLQERALKIRVKAFGEEGPAVVQSLQHLGRIYTQLAKHDKAQEMYRRSLGIMERSFSPGDPSLIPMLESYAASLKAGGKDELAKPLEARVMLLRASAQQAAPK